MEIFVRLAATDDIEAIVALLAAQLVEHDIETSREGLREVTRLVLEDARHGFMLLAQVEARAVGIAYAAAHLSAEHGGVIGWLEELYVVPEQRGRGIGARLLEEVISRARRLNWRGVELEVVAGHERAAALYLRHGFRTINRTRYTRLFGSL